VSAQPRLRDLLLEGQRVALRPLDARDAQAAFGMLAHKREILDWLEWPGPEAPEDLAPMFTSWRQGLEEGSDYHLAIVDRSDGGFAGGLDLRFRGHAGCGNLGYWVDTARWGRGLAGEAVQLAAWLCFERLEGTLLSARVFVGNEASRHILDKAGFREDHRSKTLFDGVPREQWHLSLTRSDYLAQSRPRPRAARVELESSLERQPD